jgi:CheY-like chemotaxis protein
MSVLALISDLVMQSHVSGAARRLEVSLAVAPDEQRLLEAARRQPPQLVIVDLSHPGLDPAALLAQLRPLLPEAAQTVAFGPHVHKARLQAASEAGFGAVLSRGQFHASVEQVLRSAGGDETRGRDSEPR